MISAQRVEDEQRARSANQRESDSSPPVGATAMPVYRETQEGEHRTEGSLVRIECPTGRVIFHVRVGAETTTFTAQRLDKVDFITYRRDAPAEVRCGARPAPEHVFITWCPVQAARGTTDRVVISVELLPDL